MKYIDVDSDTWPSLRTILRNTSIEAKKRVELVKAIFFRRWLSDQYDQPWQGRYNITERPDVVFHDPLSDRYIGIEVTEVFPSLLSAKEVDDKMKITGSRDAWAKQLERQIERHLPDQRMLVVLYLRGNSQDPVRKDPHQIDVERLLDAIGDLTAMNQSVAGLRGPELSYYDLPQLSQLVVTKHSRVTVDFGHSGAQRTFNPQLINGTYRKKYASFTQGPRSQSPEPSDGIDLLMYSQIRDDWSFVDEPTTDDLEILRGEPTGAFDNVYYTDGFGDYHKFILSDGTNRSD